MARIPLTKAQAATPAGAELIQRLQHISLDGQITLDEVRSLYEFLISIKHDEIEAILFLRTITRTALLDGQLDAGEMFEIKTAIERVMPTGLRGAVRRNLAAIAEPSWEDEPATERQLAYLKILGAGEHTDLSKEEASQMIDEYKHQYPPSQRQLMVLRFWSRLDLSKTSRASISEWMDRFYSEHPGSYQAWERFKEEYQDDGSQRDPGWVPLGLGWEYLKSPAPPMSPFRKSRERADGLPSPRNIENPFKPLPEYRPIPEPTSLMAYVFWIVLLSSIVGLAYLYLRTR